jgi:hemophore-related protein
MLAFIRVGPNHWKVYKMLSTTKLIVATGGVALALSAGAGLASAAPEDAIINSTCSYPQVVAALNAQDPNLGSQLQTTPAAQAWLQSLVAAAPAQRQVMVNQAKSWPGIQEYTGVISAVANTCNNF